MTRGGGEDREGAVADRGSSRQGRPVQDSAGLQDRGAGSESLARHAHIRTPLRGDADLDGVGRLSDARRVVRVLDLHDSVGALGDRRARHNAPGLPPLEVVLAGVARRNVAGDRQSPGALALQVLAAHRKPVHRGVRKRRQGNQRKDVDRQTAAQALLDGERLVGENVAERQRLDQLAMLRGRQDGIVHATSVGPGGVGDTCGAGVLRVLWGCCSGGWAWPSTSRPRDEEWAGLGVAARFNGPDMECRGELQH